jgi:hypothetical protein
VRARPASPAGRRQAVLVTILFIFKKFFILVNIF